MFSSGQLLEEFFRYFSTEFDFSGCVVNIRTGSSTSIASVLEELKGANNLESGTSASLDLNKDSLKQSEDFARNDCTSTADKCVSLSRANAERQKPEPSSSTANSAIRSRCCKRVEFKISPLCVQDPFELTHNLTQYAPASLLKHIVELMKDAHKICSEMNNGKKITLLDLLTVCKTTKKRKSSNCHFFFVSFDEATALKLATSRSVFLFIVETLEKEFGLKCERKGISAKRQRTSEQQSEPPLSKRQRIDLQYSEMPQNLQVGKESQDTDSVKEASGRVVSSANVVEQENARESEHADESGEIFSSVCTAFENTWTHCRRERRKHKQIQKEATENTEEEDKEMLTDHSQKKSGAATLEKVEESSSTAHSACQQSKGSENVNSFASPVLVFELRVESSSQNSANVTGCIVIMEHVESQEFQIFGNFFSAYKRHFKGLLQNK